MANEAMLEALMEKRRIKQGWAAAPWTTKNGRTARRCCTVCGGPTSRSKKNRICRRCYRPGMRQAAQRQQ